MPYGHDVTSTDEFLNAHPEVRAIDVLLADTSGVLRGKRVDRDGLAQVFRKGLFLPGSMFALDVQGGTIESTGLGFDDGDADRPCLPIAGTLLPVPWLDGIAQLQVSMHNADGTPFYGDPRHALARVLQRFDALDLTPVVAIELEFYLVDRERTASGAAQPPCSPLTGRREFHTQINSMADLDHYSRFLDAVTRACEAQQVPSGAALAECGPGQFEVNLKHVADARLACDHAIRLKRIVKGVALSQGFDATFMAKPYRDMAGSGTHVHVSLLDRDGRNVFASEEAAGNGLLQSAIAGLVATMPDGMAVYAPNANSYRRYRPESYVPMAATWGVNNRGVAVRIPYGGAEDRRLEHRVAGADANPYLLTAVILAGIHQGITQQLAPPPRLNGNAYHGAGTAAALPRRWAAALDRFEQSAFLRDYLGAEFVQLYAGTRRGEMEEFESFVSTLEYDWYLAPL